MSVAQDDEECDMSDGGVTYICVPERKVNLLRVTPRCGERFSTRTPPRGPRCPHESGGIRPIHLCVKLSRFSRSLHLAATASEKAYRAHPEWMSEVRRYFR